MEVADIGDIEDVIGTVDAVATDPPYGRATSTMKEPLGELYARALRAIANGAGAGEPGRESCCPAPVPGRSTDWSWCTIIRRRCTAPCPATTACFRRC